MPQWLGEAPDGSEISAGSPFPPGPSLVKIPPDFMIHEPTLEPATAVRPPRIVRGDVGVSNGHFSLGQDLPLRCWVEIDLAAARHNAELARRRSGAELLVVVKANAYGHGALEVAETVGDQAALFGVANLYEGLELKAAGVKAPVLLLSGCLPEELETVVKEEFHVCISTLEEAEALNRMGERQGRQAHVHVALDTGMGRLGFLAEAWNAEIVRTLAAHRFIRWEGLASHFPVSDEDATFTRQQIENFRRAVDLARAHGLRPRWIHLSNSAGILGFDAETRSLCNLARPGLMLYGVNPLGSEDRQEGPALRPVLTWKTRVTMVRELPPGHGVSYGRSFITPRNTLVATLACGYADGYPRQASGHGASVLIQGKRCPLLGRVTMDQIMVDATDLPRPAAPGDEAILLGTSDEETIDAVELANQASTIAWDIFTGISGRVARVYGKA